MVCIKGKYRVTAKFNKEITGTETGLIISNNAVLVQERAVDWTTQYLQFIADAKIPRTGETSQGALYDLNKFSDGACKAFRKMIEKEGIQLDVLVKSTMLYYKSGKRFKVTVGRYIEEGLWRTDYEALLVSASQNNVEQHIKQELNDGTYTSHRLG